MLWENEAERLQLLADMLSEQACISSLSPTLPLPKLPPPTPPRRRNFAPHTNPSTPPPPKRVRKTKPLPPPPKESKRRLPKYRPYVPSVLDIAVAKWLARPAGTKDPDLYPVDHETNPKPRTREKSLRPRISQVINAEVLEDERIESGNYTSNLDRMALGWLQDRGFR